MAYKNHEDHRAYHREYMRERRAMFKKHGLCCECGREDAYTLAGRRACEACQNKRRIHPFTKEDRRLLELCIFCSAPTVEGMQVCEKHLEHLHEMNRKKNEGKTGRKTDGRPNPDAPRRQWPELGFCRVCGDPRLPEYKVCQRCLDNCRRMRAKQKAEGSDAAIRQAIDHRWRDMKTSYIVREQERQKALEGFRHG